MTPDEVRTQQGRQIVDANQYMVLGTAAASGQPWASPVWFAHDDYHEFVWVSSPEARHSRNIAERPQVGIVIFDSRVPLGAGQGVYLSCEATAVSHRDLDRFLDVFNRRSVASGGEVPRVRTWRLHPGSSACTGRLRARRRCSPRMARQIIGSPCGSPMSLRRKTSPIDRTTTRRER